MCIEMLSALSMRACNSWLVSNGQASFAEKPALWLRITGSPGAMRDNIQLAQEVIAKHGGDPLSMRDTEEGSERLWQARKTMFFSQQDLVPGCTIYGTDASVPLGRLSELMKRADALIQASGFTAPLMGSYYVRL